MNSRQAILRSVQKALQTDPSLNGRKETSPLESQSCSIAQNMGLESLQETFEKELILAGGEFYRCERLDRGLSPLALLLESSSLDQMVISDHPICRSLEESLAKQYPKLTIRAEPPASFSDPERKQYRKNLGQIPLAITGADFLIANTGTVALFSSDRHHRQTSLLPQIHMVLAQPHQILPDLSSLMERFLFPPFSGSLPEAITLITGPSRTADIEKKLIKGVHGPQRLIVVFCTQG